MLVNNVEVNDVFALPGAVIYVKEVESVLEEKVEVLEELPSSKNILVQATENNKADKIAEIIVELFDCECLEEVLKDLEKNAEDKNNEPVTEWEKPKKMPKKIEIVELSNNRILVKINGISEVNKYSLGATNFIIEEELSKIIEFFNVRGIRPNKQDMLEFKIPTYLYPYGIDIIKLTDDLINLLNDDNNDNIQENERLNVVLKPVSYNIFEITVNDISDELKIKNMIIEERFRKMVELLERAGFIVNVDNYNKLIAKFTQNGIPSLSLKTVLESELTAIANGEEFNKKPVDPYVSHIPTPPTPQIGNLNMGNKIPLPFGGIRRIFNNGNSKVKRRVGVEYNVKTGKLKVFINGKSKFLELVSGFNSILTFDEYHEIINIVVKYGYEHDQMETLEFTNNNDSLDPFTSFVKEIEREIDKLLNN